MQFSNHFSYGKILSDACKKKNAHYHRSLGIKYLKLAILKICNFFNILVLFLFTCMVYNKFNLKINN